MDVSVVRFIVCDPLVIQGDDAKLLPFSRQFEPVSNDANHGIQEGAAPLTATSRALNRIGRVYRIGIWTTAAGMQFDLVFRHVFVLVAKKHFPMIAFGLLYMVVACFLRSRRDSAKGNLKQEITKTIDEATLMAVSALVYLTLLKESLDSLSLEFPELCWITRLLDGLCRT